MVVDEPVTEIAARLGARAAGRRGRRGDLHALATSTTQRQPRLRAAQVAGGWRVYSRADYAPVVERFVLDGQQARLTQAALETLAVVAYRQPVSRARVSAVRGVNVDGVVRTLLTRGLVEEVGPRSESGAILYRHHRLLPGAARSRQSDELPALAPYLPDVDVHRRAREDRAAHEPST